MTNERENIGPCPEPGCTGRMVLRQSHRGPFYGCTRYPSCKAAHGAHADGRPLGIPADAKTRHARVKAHNAFDPLWKSGRMKRGQAYRWLSRKLGVVRVHIGECDIQTCLRIVTICEAERRAPRTRARAERIEREDEGPTVAETDVLRQRSSRSFRV